MIATYPAPTNGPGIPLLPGDAWQLFKAVEWTVRPRSKFCEGATAINLPKERLGNGEYLIRTNADDLLLIVAYSQRREQSPANGFVKLGNGNGHGAANDTSNYTFNAPLPDWDGLPMVTD